MDYLLQILSTLLIWRVVLSAGLSLIVGLLFAQLLPAAAEALVVGFFAVGTTAGVVWQSRQGKASATANVAEAPISSAVAFLGMAFVGFICGGFLFLLSGSVLITLLMATCLPFLLAGVVGFIVKRRFSRRQLLFSSSAFLAGNGVPLLIRAVLDAGI